MCVRLCCLGGLHQHRVQLHNIYCLSDSGCWDMMQQTHCHNLAGLQRHLAFV